MPLLDIVGVTATGKTFFVGFGFVQNEQEPSLTFILNNLRDIYRKLNLADPRTFLVDKDHALINSVKTIFPDTDIMLCLWHVNKNILAKSRAFFRRDILLTHAPDDPLFLQLVKEKQASFMSRWWAVVSARTEQEMTRAWTQFRHEYTRPYEALVSYINDEWMDDDTAKRLLHCYTNTYLQPSNLKGGRGPLVSEKKLACVHK